MFDNPNALNNIGGALFSLINKNMKNKEIKKYFENIDSLQDFDESEGKDESISLFKALISLSQVNQNSKRANQRHQHRKKVLQNISFESDSEDSENDEEEKEANSKYNLGLGQSIIKEEPEEYEDDKVQDNENPENEILKKKNLMLPGFHRQESISDNWNLDLH